MLLCFTSACQSRRKQKQGGVVVAYVTSWGQGLPDPTVMTHINYAFGKVTASHDGVSVDNPDRLRSIVALKRQNPQLKVLLSVGGWGQEASARWLRKRIPAAASVRLVYAQSASLGLMG